MSSHSDSMISVARSLPTDWFARFECVDSAPSAVDKLPNVLEEVSESDSARRGEDSIAGSAGGGFILVVMLLYLGSQQWHKVQYLHVRTQNRWDGIWRYREKIALSDC